jgi:hypothetical protein
LLFMHEVHKVRGRAENEFEAAFRDGGMPMLTTDIPLEHRGPGTYMFDALKYRDQWESRLLRTSAWSPLY